MTQKKPQPGAITDLPDGSKRVDFSDTPVKIGGAEVTEVMMREPTVADQLAVDKIQSAGRSEVTIIANLCELDPTDIEGLTMRQYGRLQDAYRDFMV